MNVVMLLSNPYRPDPRVKKEASSLAKHGHKVTIVCWDRQNEFPSMESIDGIDVLRVAVHSDYAKGSRQAINIPRFWYQAVNIVNKLNPDIVHCHDLDTTPVGYYYARQNKIPWIYDAHECYPEQMKQQVGPIIYQLLLRLGSFMAHRASKIITINELLADYFRELGGDVSIVGNYQPLIINSTLLSRAEIGIAEEEYVVAYIGGFTAERAITPLIEATKLNKNVSVMLVGDGSQRTSIMELLHSRSRVRYMGWIAQDKVEQYFRLADVIYYGLYDSSGNSRFSSPNALFHAMQFGKPVITTDIGEIADIVRKENCGLVIEQPTAPLIAQAMNELYDQKLRQKLGSNGRRAAETKYNWAVSEKSLLSVYKNLEFISP